MATQETPGKPGPAASPLIQQQAQKDWSADHQNNTTAQAALGQKYTDKPLMTGNGKDKQ